MQGLQRGIIDLVRASLTKGKAELGPDFDWNAAYEIGCRHDIIPMLYYGVAASGIQPPDEVRQKLRLTAIKCTVLDRNQRAEIDQIERSFEARGIDYLPLKGVAMKPRYPRSEMRTMGDADILIREEQYADIRPIMGELGFTEILESDHELVWDKPGLLHLELHQAADPVLQQGLLRLLRRWLEAGTENRKYPVCHARRGRVHLPVYALCEALPKRRRRNPADGGYVRVPGDISGIGFPVYRNGTGQAESGCILPKHEVDPFSMV